MSTLLPWWLKFACPHHAHRLQVLRGQHSYEVAPLRQRRYPRQPTPCACQHSSAQLPHLLLRTTPAPIPYYHEQPRFRAAPFPAPVPLSPSSHRTKALKYAFLAYANFMRICKNWL